jgi:hypothetical protein
MKRTSIIVWAFLSLLAPLTLAQRIEKLPAFPADTPDRLKAALDSTGYRVFLPNTVAACDVWLASKVPTVTRPDAKAVIYPEFADSVFLGVIAFPRGGAHDFRGQTIRPGSYTMRYQLLPGDGNHLGAAPNPDFVLLIPIADDPDPTVDLDFGKLVELSARSAHTAHPATFEMMPPQEGDSHAWQTDDGWIVLNAPLTTKEGNKITVAIVVKGSAEQ